MKKITAYLSPESWKNFLETLGTVDRDGQSMSLIDYFYKQQATAVAEETPTPAQQAPAPHVEDAATNEPPLKKARKVPSIEESPAAAAAATSGLAPGDFCEECKMTIGSISAKEKEYKRKCRDLFLFHQLCQGNPDFRQNCEPTRDKSLKIDNQKAFVLQGWKSQSTSTDESKINPIIQRLAGDRNLPKTWCEWKRKRANSQALCHICWGQFFAA